MALLISLVVLFCSIVVPIWAVVDALSHSAVAFYAAGSNKTAWIVVIVASGIFGMGFFLGGYYLLVTRRNLQRQLAQPY